MKLRKPLEKTPGNSRGSSPHSSDSHKPLGRPEWLKEWLANQHKYVLVECGHIVDITETGNCEIRILQTVFPGTTLIKTFCWKCDTFKDVKRGATFREYLGLPNAEYPQEPLF